MSEKPTKQSQPTVLSSPGVDRRIVLTTLAGLVASLVTERRVLAATTGESHSAISFEQFLTEANPQAARLIGDSSVAGQDRYLRTIAGLAAGLRDVPIPDKWNNTDQGLTPDSYQIGFNPGGEPFRVLHWRLAPGAVCRPHAHTYGNVLTIGLEGVARVSNYEVVGEPDYAASDSFRVRRTVDQLLTPGAVNLVSLERNYIHGLVAGPDGARGLDITTPLKPRPDHGTPYLSIAESPIDRFERVYEANWDH